MGGDYGGADCVHVIDVRTTPRAEWPEWLGWRFLRSDTDVVVHDEHGNVCQFTYAEWDAFALKMKRDEFDHIGPDATGVGAPVVVSAPTGMSRADLDDLGGFADGAAARLDALPDVSGELGGRFDAAHEPFDVQFSGPVTSARCNCSGKWHPIGERECVLADAPDACTCGDHLPGYPHRAECNLMQDRPGVTPDPLDQPPGPPHRERTAGSADIEYRRASWHI
jgi:hypothetical protein